MQGDGYLPNESVEQRRVRLRKETRDFHNITDYHEKGFKGEGIGFLELESDTEHCEMVIGQFKDVAPDANTFSGNFTYKMLNGKMSDFKLVTPDGKKHDLQKFVKDNNIQIIGQSLTGQTFTVYEKPIIDELVKTGCIFVSAGGNNGESGVQGKIRDIAINVGALDYYRGEIRREYYSAHSDPLLHFATFHGEYEGTSFAQPTLSGMIALILQRYGQKTQSEMFEVLKGMCDQEGYSDDFGWGIPVLKELKEGETGGEMIIQCEVWSKVVFVDGVKHVLDVPIKIENGRTYLPLRFFSETIGATVDYNNVTQGITIKL